MFLEELHHVTSVKPINVPLSSSMFPFCKWRIRNSLQPIKCALFYKMLFSPLVVDIYSSPINEQINSTIFSGCCIVLHVKDTLFFSEKQNRQQTTEGMFSTIPKDQTFCYEERIRRWQRHYKREQDLKYTGRWHKEMNTLVYFQMNLMRYIYIYTHLYIYWVLHLQNEIKQ